MKSNESGSCRNSAESHLVPFAGGITLAGLIESDYKLLSVLSRLDIHLGFGDITVEDACRKYDLSTELFLMICSVYAFDDYEPVADSLSSDDVRRIIRYLRLSHSYYMGVQLPKIQQGIVALAGDCNDIQEKVLVKFFEELVAEIGNHFEYEERMFSDIESRISDSSAAPCAMFEIDGAHGDIGDKIDDVKSIVIKYLPETCPTELRLSVLAEIYRLREDICKHILIESKLLAPALKNI